MFFLDACGLLSIVIVYVSSIFILYVSISFGFLSIYQDPEIPLCLFLFIVFLSVSSHMMAMLSDPGIIKSQDTPLLSSGIPCRVCNVIKPPRSHHCNTCEKCITNMDHHCPWINNCVGFRNRKHFILFLIYTFMTTLWAIATFLQKYLFCQSESCASSKNSFEILFCMLGGFLCLFFNLFTIFSLSEQIRVIRFNTSDIDTWQCRKFKQRPIYTNLQETFGGPFRLSWFFPVPIKINPFPVEIIEDPFNDTSQYLS
ncbi:hypothetical protein SteCoe_26640 [Stentor coeruleus]|uniref:Palmitoyltransferase n=1 Tax=Stentor coeruleus TaxID=5963 RepID=A0A1R2BCC3_9CILI|nr:hypothetical protein SteCoe_26640 [Stentor coeruleus]